MMADVDVTDVEAEDGIISVFAPHTEFFNVKTALSEAFDGIKLDVEEITFVPQANVDIEGDDIALFHKFIDMLNEADDVQNIYHNAIVKDA
jgi:transcriptional/translational regulatory protein YebC/TACO1